VERAVEDVDVAIAVSKRRRCINHVGVVECPLNHVIAQRKEVDVHFAK